MANNSSDYLRGKILDHVLKIAAFTVPTDLYVALYTTTPAIDGTGGVEVVGGSYARQVCNTWVVGGASNERSNGVALTFPNMPAVTVVGAAIHDHLTAGNMLYVGALTSSVPMVLGNNYVAPIGSIDVQQT